ncbi:unnamed protein product [Phytophthora fragariaefolia]|uniref:Unnamed protein product n=1 Tax=Phytophthora fragariaefolia TaxID=1490495 RepID=A0A9W6U4R8_9STRA|nr:unnamed protein product [Phytophthora fragariaefolia]
MDISVFNHFKRNLGNEIRNYQQSNKIIVDETNIVGVAAKAFHETLTRAHLVDGFERTEIYLLSRNKMLANQIRVESMNHWLMEERVMHKKPKRDINAQIVSGACLMTSDESFEHHVAKERERHIKYAKKNLKRKLKFIQLKVLYIKA